MANPLNVHNKWLTLAPVVRPVSDGFAAAATAEYMTLCQVLL